MDVTNSSTLSFKVTFSPLLNACAISFTLYLNESVMASVSDFPTQEGPLRMSDVRELLFQNLGNADI